MKRIAAVMALLVLSNPAWGQSSPSYGEPIRLDAAQAIIDRAVAAAAERGFRMAVAIVEPSGELVAFARMDDTQYGSIFVAQRKAETAARYRQPTSAMEERTLAGRTVTLANPDSLPIAGGVPIVVDGRIVGAIGVSGASAAQDNEVALAALTP
ncbi:heme-binding protein [Brevundimonas sp.]|uniref:GlcG/HbpS family heme-binding protein n=1 Tax=Brevundimonas sp. TaxID=1871086 RepID=UPI002D6BAB1C|nr:heme-binding protein [Brevundimonas sp.]HYC96976.1 heme-binding protein [Brevundimonas sp.]